MTVQSAQVVICGAGIAGVSAAYFLSVRQGMQDILLVDERPPLSLTSDHSTECYRNWWPDAAMVGLTNRSIDLLEELAEESGNFFQLNRRGYLYCTGDKEGFGTFENEAAVISQLTGWPLRIHTGSPGEIPYIPAKMESYLDQPGGADLILDQGLIHEHFPYLTRDIKAALHVRRAGWMSAQQLGMYMLEQAKVHGVTTVTGKVVGVHISGGRVTRVQLEDGNEIKTRIIVNAAGPFINQIAKMIGTKLLVYHELHLKIAMRDTQEIIDRSSPLVVWSDPQELDWSDNERAMLLEQENTRNLTRLLPSGVHSRPEGGVGSQMILVLWEYTNRRSEPIYPIAEDPLYAEVVLRGLKRLVPGMQAHIEKIPRPYLDGGYYTRTRENRPLICKLPAEGAYVIGALSGFGIMSACAAGELLSLQVTQKPLPDYAPYFDLKRYDDPAYLTEIVKSGGTGQL
jgi:glycine/D-amino acid oxidase-like deaminating enzyme